MIRFDQIVEPQGEDFDQKFFLKCQMPHICPLPPPPPRLNIDRCKKERNLTFLTCKIFIIFQVVVVGRIHSITPSLHHSITPSLHHSITPSLHHSITPSLHHSITPSLHHSITPSLHHSIAPSLHRSITPSLLHSITPSLLHFPLGIWKPGGAPI